MKIDLHVHTSEVSSCGRVPAAEMARLYHKAGYDAIVITDHLIAGKNQEMPMPERVSWYLSGYRAAKAEGEKLGLTGCRILEPKAADGTIGGGMVGELPEAMPKERFLMQVKELTGQPMVRHAGGPAMVRRVALCGGSGSFLIDNALAAGADIYLTADIKYHDFQRATESMAIADIGHYESEQYTREILESIIVECAPLLPVYHTTECTNPIHIL